MKIENRSLNSDLADGATDGKYRKARPDTHVIPGMGEGVVSRNRSTLMSDRGYGFITTESPTKVNPGKL